MLSLSLEASSRACSADLLLQARPCHACHKRGPDRPTSVDFGAPLYPNQVRSTSGAAVDKHRPNCPRTDQIKAAIDRSGGELGQCRPSIDQSSARMGPHSITFGPNSSVARSPQDFSRHPPISAKIGPEPAQLGSESTQIVLKSAKVGSIPANFGATWTNTNLELFASHRLCGVSGISGPRAFRPRRARECHSESRLVVPSRREQP